MFICLMGTLATWFVLAVVLQLTARAQLEDEFAVRALTATVGVAATLTNAGERLDTLSRTLCLAGAPPTRAIVVEGTSGWSSDYTTSYNALVPAANLSAWEAATREALGQEENATSNLFRVFPRPDPSHEYAVPVTYFNNLEGNEGVVGYNLYSEAARRTALQEVVESNHRRVTQRITLMQSGSLAAILFAPVFASSPCGPENNTTAVGTVSGLLIFQTLRSSVVNVHPQFNLDMLDSRFIGKPSGCGLYSSDVRTDLDASCESWFEGEEETGPLSPVVDGASLADAMEVLMPGAINLNGASYLTLLNSASLFGAKAVLATPVAVDDDAYFIVLISEELSTVPWSLVLVVPLCVIAVVVMGLYGCAAQRLYIQRLTEVVDVLRTSNKRLDSARVRAEEAESVAGKRVLESRQMLRVISHELRTPLGGIIGLVEKTPSKDDIVLVRDCANYILKIVNDVLTLEALNDNNLRYSMMPVEVSEIVRFVQHVTEPQFVDRQLVLSVDAEELAQLKPDMSMFCDMDRMKQVLLNVIHNAGKHAKKEVRLRVRTATFPLRARAWKKDLRGSPAMQQLLLSRKKKAAGKKADGKGKALIFFEVQDDGPGIPADMQAKIFEAFFQLGGQVSVGGGTGLGLSISVRITRFFGGDIWCMASQPGEGACFRFAFVADIAKRLGNSHAPPVSTRGISAPGGSSDNSLDCLTGPMRILVVDDNAINVKILIRKLESLVVGVEIKVAHCGEEAVQRAEEEPFHLVFTDMHMPTGELSGLDVYGAMKKRGIPTIILTADVTMRSTTEDLFIYKPVTDKDLIEVLARHRIITLPI